MNYIQTNNGMTEMTDTQIIKLCDDECRRLETENGRLSQLEAEGFLENVLWKNFSKTSSSYSQILLIILIVNEKYQQGVLSFDLFSKNSEKFVEFFDSIVSNSFRFIRTFDGTGQESNCSHCISYVQFLVNIFRSADVSVVRNTTLKFLSLSMWNNLSDLRLSNELGNHPNLKKHWEQLLTQENSDSNIGTKSLEVDKRKVAPEISSVKVAVKDKGRTKKVKKSDDSLIEQSLMLSSTELDESKLLALSSWNAQANWMPDMIKLFLNNLNFVATNIKVLGSGDVPSNSNQKGELLSVIHYLQRFCELIVDLLSQLTTRRFLNTLLDDWGFLVSCRRAVVLLSSSDSSSVKLLLQLLSMVDRISRFEVDDQSGDALTLDDCFARRNSKMQSFQTLAFSMYFPLLKDLVFSSTGEATKEQSLRKYLRVLDTQNLEKLALKVGLRVPDSFQPLKTPEVATEGKLLIPASVLGDTEITGHVEADASDADRRSFILDLIVAAYCIPSGASANQIDVLNRLSLYPCETILWDTHQVPTNLLIESKRSNFRPLALPKLNLQFLTMHDYLLRNFELFRLESAFEIREDLADAIKRMAPRANTIHRHGENTTTFGGWARMALPITSVVMEEVSKPLLGEKTPQYVHCCVEVDLSRFSGDIRDEWEALRERDVIFLVCIENPSPDAVVDSTFNEDKVDAVLGKKGQKKKARFVGDDEEATRRFSKQFGNLQIISHIQSFE